MLLFSLFIYQGKRKAFPALACFPGGVWRNRRDTQTRFMVFSIGQDQCLSYSSCTKKTEIKWRCSDNSGLLDQLGPRRLASFNALARLFLIQLDQLWCFPFKFLLSLFFHCASLMWEVMTDRENMTSLLYSIMNWHFQSSILMWR